MSGLIISHVLKDSLAQSAGLTRGDKILSVNNNIIEDIIDYLYYQTDEKLLIEYISDGIVRQVNIENPNGRDIGIIFDNGLGKKYVCVNKCPFCFVDQLPKRMRKSLYLKDDDWRLSFLTGSYITLTNLTKADIKRIITMRISPLYISVHAWNDETRKQLLGNNAAKDTSKTIKLLAKNKIALNVQIVVCTGINDGKILEETISNLMRLYPYVSSVAVVPVGLTKHRKHLFELKEVNIECATAILAIVKKFQNIAIKTLNKRFVYASDELFIKAKQYVPSLIEYDDLEQLENGVGLIAKFTAEVQEALNVAVTKDKCFKSIAVATGVDFYSYMQNIVNIIRRKIDININVYSINNNFFGDSITVTGLLTGQDIISTLKGKLNEDILLISESCLSEGDGVFLDDMTIETIAEALNIECKAVTPNGYAFVNEIINS